MTAAATTTRPAQESAPTGVAGALSDTLAVTRRILIGYLRGPQTIVFLIVQPVMFVLLFVYVFGGAMGQALPPGMSYVDFLMGGIIVQTVVFGTAGSTVGIAEDLQKGIMDRFRSLPMWHGAVLAGRAVVDLLQSAFTVVLMVGIGVLVGFRVHQGIPAALAAVGLAMLFGFAFSWIAMWVGLLSGTPEAAQSGGLIWMFPLAFLSSAFVPVDSMPGWLQPVAEWNPITAMVDTVRGLTLGTLPGAPPFSTSLVRVLVWLVVLVALFLPLAVRTFQRVGPQR